MSIVINQVTRAIAHEVIKTTQGTPPTRPAFASNSLMALTDINAQTLIIERLNSTVGQGSKCVDVQVETPSTFNELAFLLDALDQDYIQHTKILATSLSNAQTSGSIKAGVVIFIQGKCFYEDQELRFIAVIKADPDKALHKTITGSTITLNYVNDLLFGNSQRLLKIGLFIEETEAANNTNTQRVPGDFAIKVFDHLMSNTSDTNAAMYFYKTFLGCKLAETKAVKSKLFFETTDAFIMGNSILTQAQKEDCRGGLFALMRGNTDILEPAAVAREIFPQEIQDAYINHCSSNGITGAFSKDNSLIMNKLKRRTIKFH